MFFCSQQWRLFPFLAAAYAMKIFSDGIALDFLKFNNARVLNKGDEDLVMDMSYNEISCENS